MLERPFEEEEIKEAISYLAADKAQEPDGFTMAFFQEFWEIVKSDLKVQFREFHTHGKVSQGLNSNFITLIPKKAGANRIQDFFMARKGLVPNGDLACMAAVQLLIS